MKLLAALLQTETPDNPAWLEVAREFWSYIEPYKWFLLVLIVFWFFARKTDTERVSFDAQAQRILEEKYRKGEISQKAYEKYRQDISLRPRR